MTATTTPTLGCLCGASGPHHPSCALRVPAGRDLFTTTGLAVFRHTLRHATAPTGRPVTVRKVGGGWGWYCQLPGCLDFSVRVYREPGTAADAGREHHRLWHTVLPAFETITAHRKRAA